jgi:hypothetical protein
VVDRAVQQNLLESGATPPKGDTCLFGKEAELEAGCFVASDLERAPVSGNRIFVASKPFRPVTGGRHFPGKAPELMGRPGEAIQSRANRGAKAFEKLGGCGYKVTCLRQSPGVFCSASFPPLRTVADSPASEGACFLGAKEFETLGILKRPGAWETEA